MEYVGREFNKGTTDTKDLWMVWECSVSCLQEKQQAWVVLEGDTNDFSIRERWGRGCRWHHWCMHPDPGCCTERAKHRWCICSMLICCMLITSQNSKWYMAELLLKVEFVHALQIHQYRIIQRSGHEFHTYHMFSEHWSNRIEKYKFIWDTWTTCTCQVW